MHYMQYTNISNTLLKVNYLFLGSLLNFNVELEAVVVPVSYIRNQIIQRLSVFSSEETTTQQSMCTSQLGDKAITQIVIPCIFLLLARMVVQYNFGRKLEKVMKPRLS